MNKRYWDDKNDDFTFSILLYTAIASACFYAGWWYGLGWFYIAAAWFVGMVVLNALPYMEIEEGEASNGH